MKRLTAITLLCLLFSTAFVAGKGTQPAWDVPDSLRSVWLYTEGIKRNAIDDDSLEARRLFTEAIRLDSSFAPAYYALASNGMFSTPDEAVELARRAWRLDTANLWYHRFYGQALLLAERYDQALGVYRRLSVEDAQNPDNFRILAALYEQHNNPYMALAMLDSAELRFGRIPPLSVMKRRLLVATHQTDKAIEEAAALVESAPYDRERRVVLAELYGVAGRDSSALAEYDAALAIDSADVSTLLSLADFHSKRRDYRALLNVTKRLFLAEDLPLEAKVRRFEQFTGDTRFYREFYPQLNDLASTLAIRYPHDKRVVELYAGHLIASGELEQALALYKLHTADVPPEADYFSWVIDIESYLQRPDSVALYVDRALKLFPDKVYFHIAKGNVLTRTEQHADAVRAYRESLRYADTDSLRGAIWGLIGDACHQQLEATAPPGSRNYARGMKACYNAYERSLRYNPDNTLVLNNYAYFLALDGAQLEKALDMAARVVELTDNNPTYLDTYGWVLFRLGRFEEARKVLRQAIALDRQNSPELMVHYGDILEALGERFLAETYWRKALEHGYDADEIARRITSKPDGEKASGGNRSDEQPGGAKAPDRPHSR
ncbi:tetratricopeptide repeat protein [Alistipes sp.]|uniref:tetratricopeptide repeat protein n=1 Tax=Alistipes sp. TaxID=1872444 RepID=UPI003AF08DB1